MSFFFFNKLSVFGINSFLLFSIIHVLPCAACVLCKSTIFHFFFSVWYLVWKNVVKIIKYVILELNFSGDIFASYLHELCSRFYQQNKIPKGTVGSTREKKLHGLFFPFLSGNDEILSWSYAVDLSSIKLCQGPF